jgi:hypothetical protein
VNTPESLDNLRIQSGNSSEHAQANWKHYKMYVKKTGVAENLHREPEYDQFLREETESSVRINNIE